MRRAHQLVTPALALFQLPVDETIETYLILVRLGSEEARDAALALREQGRLGRLQQAHVARLCRCIEVAPDDVAAGHLAKALASLGREAQAGVEALVARM